MPDETVQRIPIDPDGKQILVAYGFEHEEAMRLVRSLQEWAHSDVCAFFITLQSGQKLEFVRFPIEEQEDCQCISNKINDGPISH